MDNIFSHSLCWSLILLQATVAALSALTSSNVSLMKRLTTWGVATPMELFPQPTNKLVNKDSSGWTGNKSVSGRTKHDFFYFYHILNLNSWIDIRVYESVFDIKMFCFNFFLCLRIFSTWKLMLKKQPLIFISSRMLNVKYSFQIFFASKMF